MGNQHLIQNPTQTQKSKVRQKANGKSSKHEAECGHSSRLLVHVLYKILYYFLWQADKTVHSAAQVTCPVKSHVTGSHDYLLIMWP